MSSNENEAVMDDKEQQYEAFRRYVQEGRMSWKTRLLFAAITLGAIALMALMRH